MVRAWYLDDSDADRRLPHMTDPVRPVTLQYLEKQCGIKYWKLDADNCEEEMKKIREAESFRYVDELQLHKDVPEYEAKLAMFYTEHFHPEGDGRYVTDGSAYYDIRDPLHEDEVWIRVEVEKGDMMAFPAGLYHRFTPDMKEYSVQTRLFCGPARIALYRADGDHPARKEYVGQYGQKAE